MHRLAGFVVRHPRGVLLASVLFIALAGLFGARVVDHLSTGGFEYPESESTRAAARIEKAFGIADPDLVLLVEARSGSVDNPEVSEAGLALTRALEAEKGVGRVDSYWSLEGAPPLRSLDGGKAMVLATLEGSHNDKNELLEELTPKYNGSTDEIAVSVGGLAEVFRQMTTQVEKDLVRAEMIAIPILLILLLFVFRSVVAASLPLGVGLVAVLGTLLILRLVAAVTEVSIFALNLTTALGLGLGIDYSLFIVSRFREELALGKPVDDAVARTVETAGRTVVFSAIAVAASLSALLLFPIAFLRSFAYAGIPVVSLAAAGATIMLPALLTTIGHRIDSLAIRRRTRPAAEGGTWHRIATVVMRRPLPIAIVGIAILLFLGAPFLRVEVGLPDDRVLPPGAAGRVISDQIRADFGNEAFALSVLADGVAVRESRREIANYAGTLSRLEGVARVDSAAGSYVGGELLFKSALLKDRLSSDDATFLSVVLSPSIKTHSPEAEAVVRQIRTMDAPFEVAVTGASAALVDGKAIVLSRFPFALALIGGVTFVILFLLFGSVLVPIKAVVLNLLSLTATFGAMVWVFQEGHLAGALDFTPTGTLILSSIILMFCIAFGLSMDYEVFLLSRIKEEHDRTQDNEASVALGLEKTGRIITAAAVLIAVVFVAVISSGVSFVKMFGMGLALAVIMDATLVRAALVPAFMKLMGSANWWAPPALRRVHERFGIRETTVGGVES